MSIIQDIRDKYAKVAVIAIALALVGFILTDYFSGRSRMGGGGTGNTVGVVNGFKVKSDAFAKKVQMNEEAMKQQGYPPEMVGQQAVQQTWDQEVTRIVMAEEFKKLGMRIEKRERGDILYGPNMPADLKQQLTDPQTGLYDPNLAKQQVDQMLSSSQVPQEQKDRFNNYVYQLEQQRLIEKYNSMLSNSVNFPRWFVEKQNADNSQLARISMVKEVYSSIPDSTVKVEDSEIMAEVNKNKDLYKQEESRSFNYVTFSASASAADSAAVKNKLLALKAEFDTTDNVEQFLVREGVTNYYNGFVRGTSIQYAAKDSIFKIPVGSVYGPYLDGNNYVMAKLVGVRTMPDTVKVRHILISTESRDTTTAYNLADSLRKAIASGSNFDSLAAKFSEDPGSKDKGGLYENVPSGQMVPPFNDFIFLNPVGSKGIVKTDFGYHIIEILSQKGSGPGYKIAQLPREIYASEETISEALNKASQFAGDSRDQKSFDDNFEKNLKPKGYLKGIAPNVAPADYSVQGLGSSRALVRAIYKAKVGETLSPELVGENYVVAIVTEALKEGTMSAAKARPLLEGPIRNKKKAALLKEKVGKITTLEAASQAFGGKPIEVVDSLRMNSSSTNPSFGTELRVAGAAFNPDNKGKVVPEALEGFSGVFVIRVDNVSSTPVTEGSVADQRKSMAAQKKMEVSNPQSPGNPVNVLRTAATVKDKRAEVY